MYLKIVKPVLGFEERSGVPSLLLGGLKKAVLGHEIKIEIDDKKKEDFKKWEEMVMLSQPNYFEEDREGNIIIDFTRKTTLENFDTVFKENFGVFWRLFIEAYVGYACSELEAEKTLRERFGFVETERKTEFKNRLR